MAALALRLHHRLDQPDHRCACRRSGLGRLEALELRRDRQEHVGVQRRVVQEAAEDDDRPHVRDRVRDTEARGQRVHGIGLCDHEYVDVSTPQALRQD